MLYYDYYKGWCVCNGREVYVGMRNLEGEEVTSFPVEVYNVNEELIGTAADKDQYIDIWNADPDNYAIGVLSGLIGPFSFTLTLRPGQPAPAYVIGETNGSAAGIFEEQFETQFE